MIAALYKTKKALKENIGKPLRYNETSMFGLNFKKMENLLLLAQVHTNENGMHKLLCKMVLL